MSLIGLKFDTSLVLTNQPVVLHFTAKIIEKCVAAQFVEHLNLDQLMDPLQSVYRACHSPETALIKVQTDIMSEIDPKCVVLLTLLDLSAVYLSNSISDWLIT